MPKIRKYQCPHCDHKPYVWSSGRDKHIRDKHPEVKSGPRLEFTPDRQKAREPAASRAPSVLDDLPTPPRIADDAAAAAVTLEEPPPPDFAAPAEDLGPGEVLPPTAEVPHTNYLALIKFIFEISEGFRDGDVGAIKKPTVEELKTWAKTIAQMRGKDIDPKIVILIVSAKIFIPILWNIVLGFRRWSEKRKEKEEEELRKEEEKEAKDGKADRPATS